MVYSKGASTTDKIDYRNPTSPKLTSCANLLVDSGACLVDKVSVRQSVFVVLIREVQDAVLGGFSEGESPTLLVVLHVVPAQLGARALVVGRRAVDKSAAVVNLVVGPGLEPTLTCTSRNRMLAG